MTLKTSWRDMTPTDLAELLHPTRPVARQTARPAPTAFDAFPELCVAHGLPKPLTEFVFLPGRKFRADYAWLEPRKIILEQNGGIWRRGAHSSGQGLLRDYEKSNLAQLAGFLYLVYTPDQLKAGTCLATLAILLGNYILESEIETRATTEAPRQQTGEGQVT